MSHDYSNIVFDSSEGSYYNLSTDIFLSEDDANFLELPNENKVVEAVLGGVKFNRRGDTDDIIIDDFFLSQFNQVNKIEEAKKRAQETINKKLDEYDKTLHQNDPYDTTTEIDGKSYQ